MPYNQHLAQRIHDLIGTHPGIVEKKMFGGIGYILGGNMACGVQGDDLMVRVGTENNDTALRRPHTRPFMAMPGKVMPGWILVSPEGVETDQELQSWVDQGVAYALSLPVKK